MTPVVENWLEWKINLEIYYSEIYYYDYLFIIFFNFVNFVFNYFKSIKKYI